MEDHKVKVTVIQSGCERYRVNDEIYFEGAFIDKEKSADLCMVALNAVYPFVYAARRGGVRALKQGTVQCPDCEEEVLFKIEVEE